MKIKELPYFDIEGSLGGNQSWFKDKFMYFGGCAAITACDLSLYLSIHHDAKKLYPFDDKNLTKADFLKFGSKMKPYLRPRLKGIDTLKIYSNGFQRYLNDASAKGFYVEEFSGDFSVQAAKEKIKEQIDKDIPIPYLLLRHKNRKFNDLTWHWFIIGGYKENGDEFHVKIITYGRHAWLNLSELWDTGNVRKGGMILLKKP